MSLGRRPKAAKVLGRVRGDAMDAPLLTWIRQGRMGCGQPLCGMMPACPFVPKQVVLGVDDHRVFQRTILEEVRAILYPPFGRPS